MYPTMSKVVLNSSRNRLSTEGLIDFVATKVDQAVLRTSDVAFQNVVANGDLVVLGNADIRGEMTFIESTVLKIKDNMIELNDTNEPLRLAGVQFNRGPALAPYQLLYDEQGQILRSGFANETHSRVANCEDMPEAGGVAFWNDALKRFDAKRTIDSALSYRTRLTLLGGLVFEDGANVPSIRGDSLGNVIVSPRNDLIMEGSSGSTVRISIPLLVGVDGSCVIESTITGNLQITADEMQVSGAFRVGESSVFKEASNGGLQMSATSLTLDERMPLLLKENSVKFGLNQEASIAYETTTDRLVLQTTQGPVHVNAPKLQVKKLVVEDTTGRSGDASIAANGNLEFSSSSGVVGCNSDFELCAGSQMQFASAPGSSLGTQGDHLLITGSRGIILSAADGGVSIAGGGSLTFSENSALRENGSGDLLIDSRNVVMGTAKVQSLDVGLLSRLSETDDGLILASANGNVVMAQPMKLLAGATFGNGSASASIERSGSGNLVIRNAGAISLSCTDVVSVGEKLAWSNGSSMVVDGTGLALTSRGGIRCLSVFDASDVTATSISSTQIEGDHADFGAVNAGTLVVSQEIQATGITTGPDVTTMRISGQRIEISDLGTVPAVVVSDGSVSLYGHKFDADGVAGDGRASWRDVMCETLTVANCIEAAEDGGVSFSTPATLNEGLSVPGVLDVNASSVAVRVALDCIGHLNVHKSLAVGESMTCRGAAAFEAGVDMSGHRITNLGTPRNAGDAVSKRFLDSLAMGFRVLQSVDAASSIPVTLSAAIPATIDEYQVSAGNRVLLLAQADARENGVYVVGQDLVLSRSADMADPAVDVSGASVFVLHGTQYAGYGFVVTSGTARRSVFPTQDGINFTVYSGITQINATGGITRAGNDISLDLDAGSLTLSSDGKVTLSSTVFGSGLTGGNGQPASVSPLQPQITAVGKLTQGSWQAATIDVEFGGTGNTEYTVDSILIGDGSQPIVSSDALVFRSFGALRKGLAIGLTTGSPQGEMHIKADTPTLFFDGGATAGGDIIFASDGTNVASMSATADELAVDHSSSAIMRAGASSYLRVSKDDGVVVHGGMTVDSASVAQITTPSLSLGGGSTLTYTAGTGVSFAGPSISIDAATGTNIGGLTVAARSSSPKLTTSSTGSPFVLMDETCPQTTINGQIVSIPGKLRLANNTVIESDISSGGSIITGSGPLSLAIPLDVETVNIGGGISLHKDSSSDNVSIHGSARLDVKSRMRATGPLGNIILDIDPAQGTMQIGDALASSLRSTKGFTSLDANAHIGGLMQPGWHYLGRLADGQLRMSVSSAGRFSILAHATADPDVFFARDAASGITSRPRVCLYRANDGTRSAHIFVHVVTAPCGLHIDECTQMLPPHVYEGNGEFPDGSGSSFRSGWQETFNSQTQDPNMPMEFGSLKINRLTAGDVAVRGTMTCESAVNMVGPSFIWTPAANESMKLETDSLGQMLTSTLSSVSGAAISRVRNAAQQSELAISSNADGSAALDYSGPGSLSVNVNGSSAATFSHDKITLSREIVASQPLSATVITAGQQIRSVEHRFSDNLALRKTSDGNLEMLSSANARLVGIVDPVDGGDVCNKRYADALSYGMTICGPARVAATGNLDISQNPPTLIDEIIMKVGDIVLLPLQIDSTQRGLYRLASFSSPLVPIPLPSSQQGKQPYIYVREGTVYGGTGFTVSAANVYSQMHGPLQLNAGNGLSQTGNRVAVKLQEGSGLSVSADGLGISSSVVGQGLGGGSGQPLSVTSIAHLDTVGTINRGTWKGTAVGLGWGGTGSNSFTPGSVPFSNGSRLVDGKLRYDGSKQALGINTTTPTEGLTVEDRNILLRRIGASATSLQFSSGSHADAFAYVMRDSDAGLQLLCGSPASLQPVFGVDRVGQINMVAPIACSNLTVGNIGLRNSSFTQTVSGPFNMKHFSATNEGCMSSWYGSLGRIDNLTDSEFMRAGYYNGSYVIQTSSSGTGRPRSLTLQAGSNSDQLLLAADGTVTVNGPASFEEDVSLISSLSVFGTSTLQDVSIARDVMLSGKLSLGSSSIYTSNDEIRFARSQGGGACSIRVGDFASAGHHMVKLHAGSSIDNTLDIGHDGDAMTIASSGAQGSLVLASAGASIVLPSSASSPVTMPATSFAGPVAIQQSMTVAGLLTILSQIDAQSIKLMDSVRLGVTQDGLYHLVRSTGGGAMVQMSASADDVMYIGTVGNPTACCMRAPAGRALTLKAGSVSMTLTDQVGISTEQAVSLGANLTVGGTASFAGLATFAAGARLSRVSSDSFQFNTADAATALHYITPVLQRSMVPLNVDATVRSVRALAVGSTFAIDTVNSRVDCMGSQVQNVADPVNPGDAVNKRFLDQYVSGIIVRASVVAASAAGQNVDITRAVVTLDGVTLTNGDRILLTKQSNPAENGAYVITPQGYASRSTDLPLNASAAKSYFFVASGTTQAGLGYMCINSPGSDIVGTSPLSFTVYISSAPGSHSSPSTSAETVVQLTTQSGLALTNGKLSIDPAIAGANVIYENGVLSVPLLTRDGVPVPVDEGGTGNTVLPMQGLIYSTGSKLESNPSLLRYDYTNKCMVLNSSSWSTTDAFTCGGDICLTGLNRHVYFADEHTSTYKWRMGTNQSREFVISQGDTQTKSALREVFRLDATGNLSIAGSLINRTPVAVSSGGTGSSSFTPGGLVAVAPNGLSLVSQSFPSNSVVTGDADGKLAILQAAAFKAVFGLQVDTDVQAFSPLLQQISNLTATTDSFIVGNAGVLTELRGPAARDALGLGPLATSPTVDDTDWAGEPLSVQNGGTGSTSHPAGAILYSDAPSGKVKGTPALLWKPDVNTLTLGQDAIPTKFKIIGGGPISLASDSDGEWLLGPNNATGELGISLVSPSGEDIAQFTSSGVVLHQAQVIGNFSAGGKVDMASDVTVGGNLLVSQGISCIGGLSVLDPDDDENEQVTLNWRGEASGAFLTTSKLTVDTGQAAFTGSIDVASLKVHNPTTPSTVSIGAHSNNIGVNIKRAALYDHGVSTLYLTILCTVTSPGLSSFEINMNDKLAPFGIDALEEVTILSSAFVKPTTPLPVCIQAIPSTKILAVEWTSTSSDDIVMNIQINY